MPNNIQYYRVDEIILKMVNCPLGVKQKLECNECYWHKGTEKVFMTELVGCEITPERLKKIQDKINNEQ